MKAKVSIIVPVYNASQYLNRCLNSLIEQTYNHLEIICVDDGSTDDSLKVLKKYQAKDNRIQVITKINTGVSDSRNQALKIATGDYIMFVDSDDWLSTNAVEVLVNEAKKSMSDLVMCGYVREFSNRSKEKNFDLPEKVVYEEDQIHNLHRKLFGPLTSELGNPETLDALGTVWAKLYKSDVIQNQQLQFVDLKVIGSNEDGLFNIQVFEWLKKVTFINQSLYHYWKENENSITSKHNPNLMSQWKQLFSNMQQHIETYQKGSEYEEALRNRRCISLLGLGLNECFIGKEISLFKKISRWKIILKDEDIIEAYKTFSIQSFPLHWRLFYFFNQKQLVIPSFLMVYVIDYLRKRV